MVKSYRFCRVIYVLLWALVISACQSNATEKLAIVDLWHLMITESDIPDGWYILDKSDDPIVHFGEAEAASLIIYYWQDKLTRGGLDIYRHKTIRKAMRQYEIMARAHFEFDPDDPNHYTPIFIPEGFSFTSKFANEWRFGCSGTRIVGLLDDRISCQYLARYGQYVVYFRIATDYQGEEIKTYSI